MSDRAEALIYMVDNYWSKGIWVSAAGKKTELATVPNDYFVNILNSLVSHAISAVHYDYFRNNSPIMLTTYKTNFNGLVEEKLSTHPIWPHLKKELDKRGLKINTE